ncbi:MAG: cation:proton antiporter [Longimicrobiales bacterium]|nr:cation:proton antiporter [Longimicrobiales bacterium]
MGDGLSPLAGVLVLVLLGLLGSRLAFDPERAPLGPRLVLATGSHFLLVGLLLGPVLGLLTLEVIGQLEALFALGLGWVGLLFGLQLDRGQLAQFPVGWLLFTAVQAIVTLAVFAGLAFLAFGLAGARSPDLTVILWGTAATAAVSTPAGVALIGGRYRVQGPVTRLLMFVASLDAAIGILALQAVYAVYHPSTAILVEMNGWLWLAIAAAAGVVFGVLFLWMTRPKPERDELILFLLGLAVFEAGTAFYLGLSPLFVCMVTGIVIANLSPSRKRVYSILQGWEKPVYVVILILAGALLGAGTWLALPLAAGYVLLRGLGKLGGGAVARGLIPGRDAVPAGVGLGLVPQGGISLAMALSAALTYGAIAGPGAATGTAFATIVVAVAASELIGPLLTRDLLRRAGEIREDDAARAPAP